VEQGSKGNLGCFQRSLAMRPSTKGSRRNAHVADGQRPPSELRYQFIFHGLCRTHVVTVVANEGFLLIRRSGWKVLLSLICLGEMR
jgi:hypothetical protein